MTAITTTILVLDIHANIISKEKEKNKNNKHQKEKKNYSI